MDLNTLLRAGESETVEVKESFRDEALETLGAFANARGGTLIIGVTDCGEVRGVSLGKKTLEDWANRIAEATEPRLQPALSRERIRDRELVVIGVPPATSGPVSVRGRYFRRVGRTNQRMSRDEVMRRILLAAGRSWDAEPETAATEADIDLKAVQQFLERVREVGRQPVPRRIEVMAFLRKLRLIVDDRPTRAALLLFGSRPQSWFHQAHVRCGRFRAPTVIVDDRRVDGGLLTQVEEAVLWLRERMQLGLVITGKPQRDVAWEYPLEAVREAVVNAVCHRDYLGSAAVQVRLHDDRLEIWNPGDLPPGLTSEDLLRDHDSIPRNRQIADCFFMAGFIEQWGGGTLRMAEAMKEAGLPLPEFDASRRGRFRVILRQDPLTEERLREMGLNERQMRAVTYLRESGRITNQEYRQLTGVSNKTAYLELTGLVGKHVLTAEGTGRSRVYVLRKAGNGKVTER